MHEFHAIFIFFNFYHHIRNTNSYLALIFVLRTYEIMYYLSYLGGYSKLSTFTLANKTLVTQTQGL